MKQFTQVNNSKGLISRFLGLKSRITSTKPVLNMLALLMVCLFGVNEKALALRYGRAKAYSSPAAGGWVWVTKTDGNAPSKWEKTDDESSDYNKKISDWTFPFYYYANAQTNYTFLGWATSSSTNTTVSTTQTNWYVGVTATSANNVNWNYATVERWALFGRLTANKSSETFGSVNVGSTSSAKEVKVTYVHAGKVTATLTGDFSFESGSSSKSKTLAENNTDSEVTDQSINIYFKPTCNSTRNGKLTIKSSNGLTDVEVNLSGTGNLNSQTLSWNNESQINLNMLNGTTQNISASATSGLTVSYESSNTDVLSVDANGKLTAKAVGGPVTITAKQAGDCTYSAATSITKTFYVKTKDTPSFSPSGFSAGTTNALKVDDEVTLDVAFVSDGLSGNFTASATQVNNQDVLQITRNGNTITIKALREGTSTATFTQTENSTIFGATKSYTFNVTKVDNTLGVKNTSYSRYVEEDDDLTTFVTTNSNGTIHTSSTAIGIAHYDIANNAIVIDNSSNTSFNSTSVTIKIWQDATIKYAGIAEANAKTVTLTVKKYDNTLSCSWGSWSKDVNVETQTGVTFGSNNDTGTPIVIEQTNGNDEGNVIATYSAGTNKINSIYNIGTATWTLSQAEDYKYVAAESKTLTVNVKKASQPTCYVVDHASEQEVNSAWWDGAQYCDALELNGIGESLVSFEAKKDGGTGDVSIVQYSKDNGQSWTTLRSAFGISSDFQKFGPFPFPALSNGERITHIRFGISGTTSMISYRYKNIKVTRKKWFKLEDKDGNEISSLTMPTNILGGNHTTAKFTIDYSTCADQIKVVSNHSHITVSPASFASEGNGPQEITVTYACDAPESIDGIITVYTPYENKTINVHAETEKKSQAIKWIALFAGETVSLPQTFTSNDAASATSNLPITYISGNSGIIEVSEDGRSFTVVGTGATTLIATQAGNELWKSVSDTVNINATNKKIQRIIWNQQFTRSLSVDNEIPLTATVRVLNVATDTETESDERSAEIVYTCPVDNGVIEIFNGTNIRVLGYGNTTITASVDGNEEYEAAASVTLPVRVREAQTGDCDMPLVMEQNEEIEFFQSNTHEIVGSALAIDRTKGIPDKLSFDVRGAAWKLGIEYYKGSIQVQQSTDNQLHWSGALTTVSPAKGQTASSGEIQLDPNATHIRFVRPDGGQGYHYVGNVQISRLPYISTENATINLGNISMGETRNFTIPVSYCNVKGDMTVSKQYSDNGLTIEEMIEAECGDMDSYEVQASIQPTSVGPWTNTVTVRDPLSNMYLDVTVNATIQKGDQVITWDPTLDILATEVPELNAVASSGLAVSYKVTSGNNIVARIDNGQLMILQPGQFTITASQSGNSNYNQAPTVEKTFTISAESLTLTAPTAQNITYGQALSASELTGGSAKDSKNNTVNGTFAWQTATTVLNAGDNQTPTVVFTPSTNAAWYTNLTTTATIDVAKANPAATVENVSFAYGTKAEDVALSGTGAGTWTWTDSRKGQVLAVDTYEMDVHFAPTDDANYNAIDKKITLTVTKADPVATVENVSFAYGTKAEDVTLVGTGAGTWTWTDSRKGQVLAVDTYEMDVHFAPTDDANYNAIDKKITLTVTKADPAATVENVSFAYGTKAEDVTLVGTGAGTWAWTDSRKGQVLAVDTYEMDVHFAPTDDANYNAIDKKITLTVTKANPAATVENVSFAYGTKAEDVTLVGTGEGTWSWTDSRKDQVLTVGEYEMDVQFAPTDGDNYNAIDTKITLTVNKANPSVTPQATAIEQGQTVSQSTLSTKTGLVPGTWSWKNEDANTKPNQGNYVLLVNFTPDDADNYNSLTNVQVSLTVNAPSTYVFTGEGDWTTDENWNASSDPAEPVDVIVSGNVVISTEVTVKSLTVEEGKSVTITSTGKLTLGDESSEDRTHYGDLYVHNGGKVVLGEGTLQVNDFKLDAKLGNSTNAAASGQVDGSDKLNVNGDAFFQMTFDPNGAITYGWYDFTVPFEVEVLNGIYDANGNKLTNGVDYLVMNYSEAKRAVRGKDWNMFSGTMQPGHIYSITLDASKNWNTFLFKRKANSDVLSDGSYAAEFTSTGAEADHGWNGFGNGTLQHMQLKGVADQVKIQLYNHSENRYEAFDANEKAFAVGTAFFMQVKEANQTIEMETSSKALRAPSYAGKTTDEFRLSLTADNDEVAADRLWISAAEDATTEYTIGHDLVKMGTPTQSKVAQMWMPAGELRLCDIEMPLVNNNASTALSIYAPKAGTYTLAVDRAPENAILFLTKNGRVMWNLSQSGYLIDLSKGTTEEYGLCLVYSAPQVATGVDEVVSGVKGQKVIINNKIYIITNTGNIYDATGKKVN